MRTDIISSKSVYFLVMLLVMFYVTSTAAELHDISKLKEELHRKGEVKVIVGLKLLEHSLRPEGTFVNPAALNQQRKRINEGRERLLDSMTGFDAKVLAQCSALSYIALVIDAEVLEHLADSELVTSIHESVRLRPNLASATNHVGADRTWSNGLGGEGQTVVIIDSGIDANHPFFGDRVVDEACFSTSDPASEIQSLCPNGDNQQTGTGAADAGTALCLSKGTNICDHGTHVAGIAAGKDAGEGFNGIAPEADIIAIQVFSRVNSVDRCRPQISPCLLASDFDIISALEYVYTSFSKSHSIAAVNMSLGGGEFTGTCDNEFKAFKAALDNLLSINIAVVIASGNKGFTDAISAPACISTAVAVGAVTDPDDEVVFNISEVVDLLAPGVNMIWVQFVSLKI